MYDKEDIVKAAINKLREQYNARELLIWGEVSSQDGRNEDQSEGESRAFQVEETAYVKVLTQEKIQSIQGTERKTGIVGM